MLTSEKLYYADPYLCEFTARVLARRELAGRPAVALDRTAFYPTGGGQPNDVGTLNSVGVVDVVADDGWVWHVTEEAVAGDAVAGRVDWARRFDHMQQHTGQHILSQAFIETCEAETVGFHLGAAYSTIDLNRADVTAEPLAAAEARANAVIDRALPVTAAFFAQADLAALPLRKPPKVTEDIRVVQVAGFDWSACGGTHVGNTAQIGLIKIVATEHRGAEMRITFLCGRRARADYARVLALAQGLAARFTTAQDELLDAADRRAAEMQALRKELSDLEGQWAAATAEALWAGAAVRGPRRIVALRVDYPFERARRVAQLLRSRPGAVVILGVSGERPQLICTRSDDVSLHAGDLLRIAVTAGGGRGGGRPDWAQGGVPTDQGLQAALAAALAEL